MLQSATAHREEIGQVQLLYVREAVRRPPGAVDRLQALAGLGLKGDIHQDRLSPRHLLLAGAPAYARHQLAPNALRENLLLDIDSAGLRSGQLLQIGSQAVIWLSFHCEPCGLLDLHQAGLSGRIGGSRGMLARVISDGLIMPGDMVTRLERSLPAWSDDWRERVSYILARIPDDMVLEYKQLARLAGVALTYCRVFPKLARTLGLAHKVVSMTSDSEKMRWQGQELFEFY